VIHVFGAVNEKDVENELRAIRKLSGTEHPNLIQVFQFGTLRPDTLFRFIDMELCDFTLDRYIHGEDVPDLVNWSIFHLPAPDKDRRKLGSAICNIVEQIIEGLIFIHEHHEFHRDLSPHNGSAAQL